MGGPLGTCNFFFPSSQFALQRYLVASNGQPEAAAGALGARSPLARPSIRTEMVPIAVLNNTFIVNGDFLLALTSEDATSPTECHVVKAVSVQELVVVW